MKVKIPEPVDDLEFYRLSIENKTFTKSELEKLVKNIESDLDKIYETELKTGKISFLNYQILFMTNNKEELGYMLDGGMFLSVKAGRECALPEFQCRYKNSFKKVLADPKSISQPLNIYLSITGARDTITTEVEAKDPKEN